MTDSDFLKNSCSGATKRQKLSKWTWTRNFSDFLHEFTSLDIEINHFFMGRILFLGFRAKRDQNGPKMRFFKFYERLAFNIFLNFLSFRIEA